MRRSGVWVTALVLIVLAGFLIAAARLAGAAGESQADVFSFLIGASFFTIVGSLIVWLQPENRIGWLFTVVGLLWVTGDVAARYSTYAYLNGKEGGLLAGLGAWYGEWYWLAFLTLTFSVLPQVFPSGRPMAGRWRGVLGGIGCFIAFFVALAMLEDQLDLIGTDTVIDNPFGIPGLHDVEQGITAPFLFVGALFSVVVGLLAIVVRFRRARGDERQQLKWFTVAVVLLIVEFIIQSIIGDETGTRIPLLDGVALALVPISAAIAIFKYRLYDIDLVINKALVYGALSAILAGTYLGLVVLLQLLMAPLTADSDLAVAASTLAVAALFGPVRARVQAFIDRRFYRRKFDAEETLEAFVAKIRQEVDLDSLSRDLVVVVHETMQPAHSSLWLRSEGAR